MSNDYYKTNSLYEYIKKNQLKNLKFVSKNLWQLCYANSQLTPMLFVLVEGIKGDVNINKISKEGIDAFRVLEEVSIKTNIPIRYIQFSIDNDKDFILTIKNKKGKIISLNGLATKFLSEDGLPINYSQKTLKYLNDKTSSIYHKWQRDNLGKDLKVIDFDLFKIHNNQIIMIIELKRSFKKLYEWEPYIEDYNNFRIVSSICNQMDIEFKIVYNLRETKPWNDDISFLKVFNVNFELEPPIQYEETLSLEDFIKKYN